MFGIAQEAEHSGHQPSRVSGLGPPRRVSVHSLHSEVYEGLHFAQQQSAKIGCDEGRPGLAVLSETSSLFMTFTECVEYVPFVLL